MIFILACFTALFSLGRGFPVIIIPGLGGSVLLHGPPTSEERVWPPTLLSWKKNRIGVSCNDSKCWSDFDLRTPEIGDLSGVEVNTALTYLLTKSSFYGPLIRKLQKNHSEVSAFAYDFRMIFDDNYLQDLYTQFRWFIERRGRPHVMICHSLGGLLFHDFLINSTTQEWQRRYISRVYFVNVPFGGSPHALYSVLRNQLGPVPKIPLLNFKIDTLHHFAGLYWCMPVGSPVGSPVLRLGDKWYSGRDLLEVFEDFHLFNSRNLFLGLRRRVLKDRRRPIAVPAFIIYGSGLNTTSFLDWDSQIALHEDGDRVVPRWSLEAPKHYYHLNMTYFIEMRGMDHSTVDECPLIFDLLCNDSLPCRNMVVQNQRNSSETE